MNYLGDALNRRNFLQKTGYGIIGATVLGGVLPAWGMDILSKKSPDKAIHPGSDKPIELNPLDDATEVKDGRIFTPIRPDSRIGYAIVGLGTLTLNEVLPAFGACKYSKPVALVSGHFEKAKKVADQYGIPHSNIYNYEYYDKIRDNPDIDAVYVALPNSMHAEYTIRAANAGKHVLCEKPMAATSEEAKTMVDACKKVGKKLMIGYRIQHEPNNRQMMEWVRNKEYGEVKIIESINGQHIGDASQWRLKRSMGGGALGDVGIYCLNTIRFLLGEEPESVLASMYSTPGDPRFTEVEETVLFQLLFPSGVMANCCGSFGIHQCRRYRCYADQGGWFGMDPAFPYRGLKMEVSQARDKMEWKSNPSMGEKNQFALEMDHFSKCIMEDTEPYTTGEEGLQDMRIMDAIIESAKTGKAIKLPSTGEKDAFRGTQPQDES